MEKFLCLQNIFQPHKFIKAVMVFIIHPEADFQWFETMSTNFVSQDVYNIYCNSWNYSCVNHYSSAGQMTVCSRDRIGQGIHVYKAH